MNEVNCIVASSDVHLFGPPVWERFTDPDPWILGTPVASIVPSTSSNKVPSLLSIVPLLTEFRCFVTVCAVLCIRTVSSFCRLCWTQRPIPPFCWKIGSGWKLLIVLENSVIPAWQCCWTVSELENQKLLIRIDPSPSLTAFTSSTYLPHYKANVGCL